MRVREDAGEGGTRWLARVHPWTAELMQPILEEGPAPRRRGHRGRTANARMRAAYARAVGQFLGWCEAPLHVAAYIRTHPGSVPTVKHHLAAIRMLGGWLVVS